MSKLPPEPPKSAAPATPHSVTAAPQKPAEKPVTPPPPAKPAPEPAKAAPQPGTEKPATPPAKQEPVPKSFEVQVGVFTDMENAKQLQAKLAEHGIPSHTETKLQVGPFNTKAEADAAREKLKALGIGAAVVPGK
jgi:DedD protein